MPVALAQADGGEVAEDSNGDDDHDGDEWNVQPTVTPARAGRFGGKAATIFVSIFPRAVARGRTQAGGCLSDRAGCSSKPQAPGM